MKFFDNVKVIKRDNTVVDFDHHRIENAITQAASRSKEELDIKGLTCAVLNTLHHKINSKDLSDHVSVEEIQDVIIDLLINFKMNETAKEFISYRRERSLAREQKNDLTQALNGFLDETDDTYRKENANKAATELSTHRDLIAGIVSKQIAKHILPRHVVESIERGELHVHDLDYILSRGITNCGVYDFPYMLAHGVKLGDVDIESPKNVQTAANVMCQILCKISGVTYGGQSVHEFDQVLRPYVLKTKAKLEMEQKEWGLPDEWLDQKLHKAVYDACQTFLYQSTTCTSPNGQASFCSISLSLAVDPICKLVKEEYLKCHMNGLGAKHKTPIFPKVLYFAENGVNLNEGDPNYDEFQLAIKCSTERMYPDYISAVNNRRMTGGSENVISPMGCRSFVPKYIENGHEKVVGRFNLGVTTVNLPYVALEADGDKERLFDELDRVLEIAFDANMCRIERMKGTKAKVAPILWQYGALAHLDPEDTIDHLFYNGNATCSIGYGGLYELLEICHDTSKYFAYAVMDFLNSKCEEFTERTNIKWSVYGSPMESTCYEFANKIKRDFTNYNLDKEYITNSFHLPVDKNINIFDKLEWESGFYMFASGGNVNNIEIPNMRKNPDALMGFVRVAMEKDNYLIVNQPVDRCFECGYEGEFTATEDGYHCPVCGNNNPETAQVIRRISGYIHDSLARPANTGKYDEQRHRVKNY